MATEKQIGKVTHFYDKIGVGVVRLTNNLKAGDKIHIKGAHDDFEQKIESIQLDHKAVSQGKKGQEIAIKLDSAVHKNDKVFLVRG